MSFRASFSGVVVLGLTFTPALADRPWGRGGRWDYGSDGDDDDGSSSSNGNAGNGFEFGSAGAFDRANTILIAHAVLASAVWVLFVPWAALLLRIGLKNPLVLKLHAFFQILSYLIYIAAAGMG
jgi:hypothetical protein